MPTAERPYAILAAIAFDETGMFALQQAASVVQQRPGAELHLVHVVTEHASGVEPGVDPSLNAHLASVAEQLQRHVDLLGAENSLRITAHIRTGTPARRILQTAADLDADLIVVGTRDRGRLEKLVLGSTAEQVLQDADCPVLVAIPKDHARSEGRHVDPACAACSELRRSSGGRESWCERHSRERMPLHVCEPWDMHVAPLVR